ncbi:PWWP domain-containing protein 2A-like [Anguilla rostrata]|uniref:PWWP domain-containing protein 2A-like n=1 Tax=Anguilla rostrata TaxID=7938 RepID=UPI0030CEED01
MAAVAAEPGAAAASTTVGDGTEFESEAKLQTEATSECASVMDLMHIPKDQGAGPECRLVNPETRDRPEQEAAGKAYVAFAEEEQIDAGCPMGRERETEVTPKDPGRADLRGECESFKAEFSPVLLEVANEVSAYDSITRSQPSPTPISTSEPSVVFLHSHCTPLALEMESGLAAPLLSSVEPVETKTEYATSHGSDATAEPTEIVCEVRALIKPLLVTEPQSKPTDDAASPELEIGSTKDAVLKCCEIADDTDPLPVLEKEKVLGTTDEMSNVRDLFPCNSSDPPATAVDQVPPVLESEDLHAPRRVFRDDSSETLSESKSTVTDAESTGLPPDSIAHLSPGSEVRVSLDHIIDDALVVSFQLGEKIFSGVLMDLSKRFGPYGIPVTVFPRRQDRDRPESMQLKTEPFPLGVGQEGAGGGDSPDSPPKECSQNHEAPAPPPAPTPTPSLWTSKPPPLFQEGAPYPPPLFIRDTYSLALPQPPPRRIKRPKRRLLREEPTSIMSAIRLRPRQVLCDKCKGAVATAGDRREARGAAEEARRRRGGEGAAAGGKRPRSEERARGAEGPKRQAPAVRNSSSSSSTSSSSSSSASSAGQLKGGGGGNRVPRGAPGNAPPPPPPGNAKKVLQSKNVDHCKAREVLKLAKAQRRQQREGVVVAVADAKARTRAAALQDAHQKVHFTRRLHRISAGGVARLPGSAPLPSRIRIKPQRYRTGENPPGLPVVQGGGCGSLPEPAPPCSSSSSCSQGNPNPATAADKQGCAAELEPETRPSPQSQPQPCAKAETRPQVTIGEVQGGLKAESGVPGRRETRGGRAVGLTVYATLDPVGPASVCSVDSADDVKSSNSECSSTETFVCLPPGTLPPPPFPSTSSPASTPSSSSSSWRGGKGGKSPEASAFSRAPDGSTVRVGDIVWAKIRGFPWWPARVQAVGGPRAGREARVSWFGSPPSTSCLPLSQLSHFLENFLSRFDRKRKGPYRRAVAEAAKAARRLPPEVRALLQT